MRLNLKNKMQLYLIGASVIIYVIAIGYVSITSKRNSYSNAIEIVNSETAKYAYRIQDQMNRAMTTARTLSKAFLAYNNTTWEEWNTLMTEMYLYVYKDNPDFYNLWDSWELSAIDSTWNKPYGRISHQNFTDQGVVHHSEEIRSLDGDNEIYSNIKNTAKDLLLPIYVDVFTEDKSEVKVLTSLISAIIENNRYIGMVGVDITLEKFQELVSSIDLEQYDGNYAFLISHGGKYAGHPNAELLNTPASFQLDDNVEFDLQSAMETGKKFTIFSFDELGNKQYVSFHPIEIGKTGTPWFLGISVPVNSIMAQADRNFMISILVGIIGILILSGIIYVVTSNITKPLTRITNNLKKLSKGYISKKLKLSHKTGDEIEEITNALNDTIEGLNLKSEFANQIGKGNLDHDFNLLSEHDDLGKSLINMRKNLADARDEEKKRSKEAEQRRWTNEGLAKFADILRQNNDDLELLADKIIKNLVYYLDANQGGIFMLSDEEGEKYLELISAFAYDTKKYHDKRIEYGDGLVGACAIEKETIYMKDLPDEYIEITSGLGGANPNNLLLVPLRMEEKVYGVIEIASFKIIEKFQIEFVEKVAQSIASTLSTVQMNIKTNELLEKFQQQSEEMAAQEEEMRQNLEELQATQEEAARKTSEMESLIQGLNATNYIIEYDLDGYVTDINEMYLQKVKLKKKDVIGTHHAEQMEFDETQKRDYDKFWKNLRMGIAKKEITKIQIEGETLTFMETYTPLLNEHGEVNKILKISNEISEFKG